MLESLEAVARRARRSATARRSPPALLCERFGFRGDKARTLVRDLSGGERRRLQLMRLLMDEPNVLLLDEPTNDLDIDTLTALEDLLDGWPGTLVVVSHDRYFVERVCDDVYALDRRRRRSATCPAASTSTSRCAPRRRAPAPAPAARRRPQRRRRRRGCARRARRSRGSSARSSGSPSARPTLHEEMAASATDHERLRELQARARGAGRRARARSRRPGSRPSEALEA